MVYVSGQLKPGAEPDSNRRPLMRDAVVSTDLLTVVTKATPILIFGSCDLLD